MPECPRTNPSPPQRCPCSSKCLLSPAPPSLVVQAVAKGDLPGSRGLVPPCFHLGLVTFPLTPLCHRKYFCQLPRESGLPQQAYDSTNGAPQRDLKGEEEGAEIRPTTVPSACGPKSSLQLCPSRHSDFLAQRSIDSP